MIRKTWMRLVEIGAMQNVNTWANAQIINRVQQILDEWGSPSPQPWKQAPP